MAAAAAAMRVRRGRALALAGMGKGKIEKKKKRSEILIRTLGPNCWRLRRKKEKGSHGTVSLALPSFEVGANKFFSHRVSEREVETKPELEMTERQRTSFKDMERNREKRNFEDKKERKEWMKYRVRPNNKDSK